MRAALSSINDTLVRTTVVAATPDHGSRTPNERLLSSLSEQQNSALESGRLQQRTSVWFRVRAAV